MTYIDASEFTPRSQAGETWVQNHCGSLGLYGNDWVLWQWRLQVSHALSVNVWEQSQSRGCGSGERRCVWSSLPCFHSAFSCLFIFLFPFFSPWTQPASMASVPHLSLCSSGFKLPCLLKVPWVEEASGFKSGRSGSSPWVQALCVLHTWQEQAATAAHGVGLQTQWATS